jgi:hypothetical protein
MIPHVLWYSILQIFAAINGMYVCVLGIPKCKFSTQMKKKNLVTELLGLSTLFPEFIDV